MKIRCAVFLLPFFFSLLFLSCNGRQEQQPNQRTLIVLTGSDVSTFDPQIPFEAASSYVLNNIFEPPPIRRSEIRNQRRLGKSSRGCAAHETGFNDVHAFFAKLKNLRRKTANCNSFLQTELPWSTVSKQIECVPAVNGKLKLRLISFRNLQL